MKAKFTRPSVCSQKWKIMMMKEAALPAVSTFSSNKQALRARPMSRGSPVCSFWLGPVLFFLWDQV